MRKNENDSGVRNVEMRRLHNRQKLDEFAEREDHANDTVKIVDTVEDLSAFVNLDALHEHFPDVLGSDDDEEDEMMGLDMEEISRGAYGIV